MSTENTEEHGSRCLISVPFRVFRGHVPDFLHSLLDIEPAAGASPRSEVSLFKSKDIWCDCPPPASVIPCPSRRYNSISTTVPPLLSFAVTVFFFDPLRASIV